MAAIKSFPYVLEQCKTIKLKNPSKWEITGHSRAGERTGFFLKPLKIILDAGLVTFITPVAVFITHSHCDHTLAMPTIVTGRALKAKGQDELFGRPAYMTQETIPKLQRFMEGVIMLSTNSDEEIPDFTVKENIMTRQGHHPIAVKAGDIFRIHGLENIEVEVLKAYHNADCVGYGFSTIRKKLKQEYAGKNKDAIMEAKKKGINISEEVAIPELAFYCDSRIDNLTLHSEWKKYPVVMCECTGYPGHQDPERMNEIYHTHLDQLLPVMEENKDKQWILLHASMSISETYLAEAEDTLRNKNGLDVTIIRD